MKESIQESTIHQPRVCAVCVSENRERTGFGDDRTPPRRDFIQGFIPSDGGENARAFRSDPAQRRREPLGRVDQFGVPIGLGARKSRGEGVIRITPDLHHLPVLDRGEQRTQVRTIVRTDDPNRFHLRSPRRNRADGGQTKDTPSPGAQSG